MKNRVAWVITLGAGQLVIAAQGPESPRVFVSESGSCETSGGSWGPRRTAGGWSFGFAKGGAQPQTAEIIRALREKCPRVTITTKRHRAEYVLLLDHEGSKTFLLKQLCLFNKDGDSIKSRSMVSLGSSVENACVALMEDWKAHSAKASPAAGQKPH